MTSRAKTPKMGHEQICAKECKAEHQAGVFEHFMQLKNR